MNIRSEEKELWKGKPKQGVVFNSRDALMIPFSMLWCGFAIFWTIGATNHGAPAFFAVWGCMFVAVGLYFVFGRFIHDSIRRSKTAYCITDKRIIIERAGTEESIPINQWSALKMEKYSDGTGTIKFGEFSGYFGSNMGIWMSSFDKVPQFYRIDDPDRVMGIIVGLTDR